MRKAEAGSASGLPSWRRSREAGLRFWPVGDEDLPFLSALYASTRWQELEPTGWSDEQKRSFLSQQFAAQHHHYLTHYTGAERLVVRRAGRPIGRLYLARWQGEDRIVDVAFMPEACNRGYGTAVLGDALDEAFAAGKYASIHVEKNNPAKRLYLRLGFTVVEDKCVYDLMAAFPPGWQPS
ncbi:GNAT family N-acetyltransferase (plasmid) [Aminobacter sp. UC22_36]|uniref:GNAT family N-acetyltransferase n=1 Tax=Aminobacter sp. UC22_36 TaxID=3374549 RepID=UPI0037577D40